jgi:hypothetical protein
VKSLGVHLRSLRDALRCSYSLSLFNFFLGYSTNIMQTLRNTFIAAGGRGGEGKGDLDALGSSRGCFSCLLFPPCRILLAALDCFDVTYSLMLNVNLLRAIPPVLSS